VGAERRIGDGAIAEGALHHGAPGDGAARHAAYAAMGCDLADAVRGGSGEAVDAPGDPRGRDASAPGEAAASDRALSGAGEARRADGAAGKANTSTAHAADVSTEAAPGEATDMAATHPAAAETAAAVTATTVTAATASIGPDSHQRNGEQQRRGNADARRHREPRIAELDQFRTESA
jgi:hypothetical protein